MPPKSFGPSAPNALHRSELLQLEGPTIPIVVRGEPGQRNFQAGYRDEFPTNAIIDTGASEVCIDYRIAHALDLRAVDQRTIQTVGGPILVQVFLGLLEVPGLKYRKLTRLYAPKVERVNYNALLGRSFLKDFYVTFEGPTGVFHFVHKDDAFAAPPDDE